MAEHESTGATERQPEFRALGITPEVQVHLDRAALAVRQAIGQLEEAYQIVEMGSDTYLRCSELINELNDLLGEIEWQPPAEGGAP